VLITLMGATATYPLSANSHGFVDHWLERIDASLRFNWIAWYDLVAAHRSLQLLGTFAYQSIFVTPAILLGYFAWSGHRAEARAFIASFWLAAVMSLILFRFIPAEGPLAFLWHRPIPYMPESALYEAQLIPALRHHMIQHVDLGQLRGLVSAPSFHTASVVLFIAAAWPFRHLRWPLIIVNIAMLLSTPVEGTHYLTDMIAGALVAVAALRIVAVLGRRLARVSDPAMNDGDNDFSARARDLTAVPAE
jgi:membrane-associated phospholipid phosphatase